MQTAHLIAISGMGMGTLAGLLKSVGYHVTGSDENVFPPMSHQLRALGIPFAEGYAAHHVDHPDLVIVGNIVQENNVELQTALRHGLRIMAFPQALAEFFIQDRTSCVVTGSHGKTTTTALVSWILEHAGRDPSFFIGGIVKNFNASFKRGGGPCFISEGDEYHTACFNRVPKFMHYRPTVGVINSLELDHADVFPTLEHLKTAFRGFVNLLPASGFLAACVDYPAVQEVIGEARCELQTYGLNPGARWNAIDLVFSEPGTEFTVLCGEQVYGRFFVPLCGRHNVQNSLAATLVCSHLGLSPDEIRAGLATFQGVRRRQEVVGIEDDVIVLDDFAHHPTKVRETIRGIKTRYPRRRLWAVFEPRTQSSRRDFFQQDYVASFMEADQTVLADVYRPDQIESDRLFSSHRLVDDLEACGKRARFFPSAKEIVAMMTIELKPGDVVLLMSSGAFDGIHGRVLEALRSRRSLPSTQQVVRMSRPDGQSGCNLMAATYLPHTT